MASDIVRPAAAAAAVLGEREGLGIRDGHGASGVQRCVRPVAPREPRGAVGRVSGGRRTRQHRVVDVTQTGCL